MINDIHSGHKLGLCNPETELEDHSNGATITYHPDISEIQKLMWDTHIWGLENTIDLADKDDIILVHDGDPTHGKAPFLETMGTRMSDQIIIAEANFAPWLKYKNVKMMRFAIGTGIHEMGEGSSSILIANALQNEHHKLDVDVVYHGELDIDGFKIDYAHHGPNIGTRVWLTGNEMRLYLRSIMMREIMDRHDPPDLVMRGHYHTYHREYLEINTAKKAYGSWIVLLPGFTFKDDYTRRATKSEFKQGFGILVFELVNGKLHEMHKFIRSVDLRTKEVYQWK